MSHTSATETKPSSDTTDRRNWRILAVVLAGTFMAVLDTTIVNVALPSIAVGVHATSESLEWVVSGYALAFGLVLVPAGRIGDRYGYKRLFLTGLALFTVASVACGISSSPGELIAARLVQGLGAGIYYPAISAIIQRLFTGRDRSRAFGFLGGVVGLSTAAGPLLGGVIIELAGQQDGWRWVFWVNLIIGAVVLPVAFRMLPRRRRAEEHHLDPVGNLLLTAVLLLLLIPLVEGRAAGWPAWSWLLLGLSVPAGAVLTGWEIRQERRGLEPVLQVGLLRRHRSFGMGQLLALLYFAGFTSLFFTLSIMWQEGLGRSALETGALVLPFAIGALATASNSFRFSRRFGRATVLTGICAMFTGQALMLLVLFLSGSRPGFWALTGPLLLAGLGNGIVIAPNQDFVLSSVPREQAGTAGGALITAQRLGAAIGIAVIGTALFGSGSSGGAGGSSGGGTASQVVPMLVHSARDATIVNLCFILAALLCAFGLPRRLAGTSAGSSSSGALVSRAVHAAYAAARRLRLRSRRRSRARSSGVVPPQIPCPSPVRIANSRHCRRTAQPAQICRASSICLPPLPPGETGKNRSGSAVRQAPAALQSGSVMFAVVMADGFPGSAPSISRTPANAGFRSVNFRCRSRAAGYRSRLPESLARPMIPCGRGARAAAG